MRAIVQTVFGGPDVLHFADTPRPEPGPRDLLVRVAAVSVNPVDAKVRGGGPAGQPVPGGWRTVGWDAAGVVEAVSSDVTGFAPGDEVYFAGDITRPGSYAEYVCVDERIAAPKPATLSFAEAAAIPLTALTAWEALFEQLRVGAGAENRDRTLLVVGGGGGVGSIAVQIARRVAGLYTVATASRPESAAFARHMGADGVIDHTADLAEQLDAMHMRRADYIFTTARLGNMAQLAAALRPLGAVCAILGGEEAKALDVSALYPLRATLTFELMFTRPRLGVEPERQGRILRRVADLLDQGVLRTTMTQELSWEQAQEAHRQIETGHTVGKIVLTLP